MISCRLITLMGLFAIAHPICANSPLLSPGEARMARRKMSHRQQARALGLDQEKRSKDEANPASPPPTQDRTDGAQHSSPWTEEVPEKRGAMISGGVGTWYSGAELNDPACGGDTPSPSDSVVAVPDGSPAECWQWIRIEWQGKSTTAQVVDNCGTCENEVSVDMTPGVFSQLADMNKGQLPGITWQILN